MADLLTHVLVPFIGLTVLGWRIEWIEDRWIPVAMGGAAIPDLTRIDLVLDDSVIEGVLGIPFSWGPVGTLAGVMVIGGAIALWFTKEQGRVFGWLLVGGLSALVLDGLRAYADGLASFWLYPIWWRPPTPSLYVSSDYRATVVAVFFATGVFLVDRWVINRTR